MKQTKPFHAVITETDKANLRRDAEEFGWHFGIFFDSSGKLRTERINPTAQYEYLFRTDESRMLVRFQQFRRGGRVLLAVPNDIVIAVIGNDGTNYGSFTDIESFDKFMARNGGIEKNNVGKARLSVVAERTV